MIDFIIIGAMKSGTTSLKQYLSAHPEIYMPEQTELEFFRSDELFSRGVDWYLDQWFRGKEQYCCGEASVHNMCYESVPERIYTVAPRVKLIAILRNPIDRAYSHYMRMPWTDSSSEAGRRDFDTVVSELIARGRVSDVHVDLTRDYVLFGEYGRILANYLRFFRKDQIHVIFFEDLVSRRREVIRSVFAFLGVAPDFESDVFDRAYNQYVDIVQRYPRLNRWLLEYSAVRSLLKGVLPSNIYEKLQRWFWGDFYYKTVTVKTGPSVAARRALREHYAQDVEILEQLLEAKTPWEEFHRSA